MPITDLLMEPERRQEAAREQAELRARLFHLLPSTPARAHALHGQARELAAVSGLLSLPPEDFAGALGARMFEQLAEAYALQGRFREAVEWSLDPRRAHEYEQKARALECLGVKMCACPPEMRVASPKDAKGERRETQRVVEEVFDEARGCEVKILRCDLCGVLSARRS